MGCLQAQTIVISHQLPKYSLTIDTLIKSITLDEQEKNMSNLKATVPCPHCVNVSTFTTGFSATPNGNGQSPAQCPSCRKTFWIVVHQGQVKSTHK
jgi:transposase-like protein